MNADDAAQEEAREMVVGGSVNRAERELIEAAQKRARYKNMSEYVRVTMLRRSQKIMRDKRYDDARAA